MEEIITNTDLSPTERVVLAMLVVSPDSNQTGIAKLSGVDRGNVSRILSKMAERGFVEIGGNGGKGGRSYKLTESINND